jgi:arabinan endo-1,5-alpha-L-arabinosidase
MLKTEIQMRDPFVVPDRKTGTYYMFGTTDKDPWKSPGVGFDCYTSKDLEHWDGPIPAFRPEPGFWGTHNFWAPEVHEFRGRWYMFASFAAEGKRRGTQILAADLPAGPYRVHSPRPITPPDWECLDGTLYVDSDGSPWMVFCHEWTQIGNGEVRAVRLYEDLTEPAGEPLLLFTASQAPWTRSHTTKPGSPDNGHRVTDGPFMHRTADGTLLMLWSSFSGNGYAMGVARSESGRIEGPWTHLPEPIADDDSGHGMAFRAFDGRLYITVHKPNKTPFERPVFIEIDDRDGTVSMKR